MKKTGNHYLYRLYDENKCLLYIGISANPIQRLAQHRKLQPWFSEIDTMLPEAYDSIEEAMRAETKSIIAERPKYNKQRNNGLSSGGIGVKELETELMSMNLYPMQADDGPLEIEIEYYDLKEIKKLTGLSVSGIYRSISKGDFPPPVKLSPKCSRWIKNEVIAWRNSKIVARPKWELKNA